MSRDTLPLWGPLAKFLFSPVSPAEQVIDGQVSGGGILRLQGTDLTAKRKGTTVVTASAALVKAIVGTGIFALPPAIRASGLLLGSAVSLLMGVVSLFTTWIMLEAVRELRRRGHAEDDAGRIEYVAGLYSGKGQRDPTEWELRGACQVSSCRRMLERRRVDWSRAAAECRRARPREVAVLSSRMVGFDAVQPFARADERAAAQGAGTRFGCRALRE